MKSEISKKEKYKKPLFIFYFSVAAVFLISCGAGWERQKLESGGRDYDNASFIVEEVTKAKNLDLVDVDADKGIPSDFTLNLQACIKDKLRTDVSITDTVFYVEYESYDDQLKKKIREIPTSSSDSNGCVQWSEKHRYKFVKNPPWIEINRRIKTKDHAYSGEAPLPLAVNPWLTESDKGRPIILDLRRSYSKGHRVLEGRLKKLDFLAVASKDEFPQLWAPVIEMQDEVDPVMAVKNRGKALQGTKLKEDYARFSYKRSKSQYKAAKDEEKENSKALKDWLTSYRRPCKGPEDELCSKRYLKLNFFIPLYLRRYDTKGRIVQGEIKWGEYDVNIQLVVIPDEKDTFYRLHNKKACDHKGVSLNKGKHQKTVSLSLQCYVGIPYFNKNANYKALLEIIPKEGLAFKKFQGAYTFKFDFTGLKKKYPIDSDKDLDERYSQALRTDKDIDLFRLDEIAGLYDLMNPKSPEGEDEPHSQEDYQEWLAKWEKEWWKGGRDSHSFYQPYLDGDNVFEFATVDNTKDCKNNDNVVRRSVYFNGKICLKDTLTDEAPAKARFRVFLEKPATLSGDESQTKKIIKEIFHTNENGGEELYHSDPNGCIDLLIPITHNVYDRQQYFPMDIHFLSEGSNYYALVKAALNPWQRAFQAHMDATKLPLKKIRFETTGVKKPNMIINQFRSVNLFPSYALDKFLNIHLYHRVYFLFQPFIQRPDDVSLGLNHRSRELLRDGYYMTRLLLLRNPQETGKLQRVLTEEEVEKRRKAALLNKEYILNKDLDFDVSGAEYITHTDTIVPVEANFVNLYMPLYVTAKQLYYVASRNLISIEIVPVDPKGFKFKKVEGGGECELDLENTKWRPYYNHELKSRPYVGAFNIQNWTNWNILQPAPTWDSDKIIDQSKTGGKYKLFSLSGESEEWAPSTGEKTKACVNYGDKKDLLQEPSQRQVDWCIMPKERDSPPPSPRIVESLLSDRGQKKLLEQNVLQEYAEQNALKVLDLSTPEGRELFEKFEKDIKKALDRLNLKPSLIDMEEISALLPANQAQILEEAVEERCSGSCWFGIKDKKHCSDDSWGWKKDKECRHKIIQAYIEDLQKEKEDGVGSQEYQDFLISILEDIGDKSKFKSWYDFQLNSPELDKEKIMDIVDNRVNGRNAEQPEVLTFAKSLCYFWFDSYLRNYLGPDEMLAAYTNYIRKFNYYRALEMEGLSSGEKRNFFKEFARHAGIPMPQKEGIPQLSGCHKGYRDCVLSDHCQLSFLNTKKQEEHCSKDEFSNGENSCRELLEEECQKDPSLALCYRDLKDQKQCSRDVNNFCSTNKDHPLCYKFSNRCLRRYRSCMKSGGAKLFDVESIVRLKCYKDPDLEFKYCLKDPESAEEKCQKDFYELHGFQQKECIDIVPRNDNPLPPDQPIREWVERPYPAPIAACLANPYQFFNFENKMIIHKLSKKEADYQQGFLRNFNVTGNFSLGSYMNWTAQRGHSISHSEKASVGIFKFFDLSLNMSESMSSNESNSSRRAVDVRAGEGIFPVIAQAILNVNVKEFQKCLVIRPRPHAFFSYLKRGTGFGEKGAFYKYDNADRSFWTEEALNKDFKKIFVSRPGLIVCNPIQKRSEGEEESIEENYYYITQSQLDPSNSQFLNLYDLANRPLMNILRGREEFIKFYHLMKSVVEGDNGNPDESGKPFENPGNLFTAYTHPVEEAVGLSLELREFRLTGFYPGVYHYSEDSDKALDNIFKREGGDMEQWLFNGYRKIADIFSIPASRNSQIPVSEPE